MKNFGDASGGVDQLKKLLDIGPGGGGDIMSILKNLPGFQFALDTGSQNVMRNNAATGQLNSGKTNVDLMNYGEGVASQNYNNYVSQLQPFLGAAGNAAGGIAGVNTGLGNQLNASLMGQGNAAYGAQTSIGNANANADLAGLTASGNMIGGILGAARGGILSDKRAKDDIEPVGELYDGQQVYRYRYKGGRRHQIGLIAQEVERRAPGAVVPIGRLKGVDYRRATEMAAKLGRYMKAA